MYGVVKGDPKGDGEVVFKGSVKKQGLWSKTYNEGRGYVINSHL